MSKFKNFKDKVVKIATKPLFVSEAKVNKTVALDASELGTVLKAKQSHSNSASVTITEPPTPATVANSTEVESAVVVTEAPILIPEIKADIPDGKKKEIFVDPNFVDPMVVINSVKEKVKAMEPPKSIVKFDNVTKSFDGKIAIKDVTFDVVDLPNTGELISIVGPSGCGKSTILRIIAGLEPQFPPTSGSALVLGESIVGPCRTRGVVDQKYSLLPFLTVIDNISFGLKLQGVGRKERRAKAMDWTHKVGLDGNENKYPHELSGGMQQRVSLASTLILEPKILLMDEPFGALDPKTRLKMQELLVSLWKEIQATIFIVTHSMEEAIYLGDRIYRMESNPGRLVEELKSPRPDISPEEMRKEPWFAEMVEELLERVENSRGKVGELKAIERAKESNDRKEAKEHLGEVDLFKLIS